MTRRKTTTKQAAQAPTEAVESVKQKSNTKVAQANTTAKKASTGGSRGRPKKVVDKSAEVEVVSRLVQKVADVESPIITYVGPMTMAAKQEPEPSLYDRFVAWLTYKLYQITFPFRGY